MTHILPLEYCYFYRNRKQYATTLSSITNSIMDSIGNEIEKCVSLSEVVHYRKKLVYSELLVDRTVIEKYTAPSFIQFFGKDYEERKKVPSSIYEFCLEPSCLTPPANNSTLKCFCSVHGTSYIDFMRDLNDALRYPPFIHSKHVISADIHFILRIVAALTFTHRDNVLMNEAKKLYESLIQYQLKIDDPTLTKLEKMHRICLFLTWMYVATTHRHQSLITVNTKFLLWYTGEIVTYRVDDFIRDRSGSLQIACDKLYMQSLKDIGIPASTVHHAPQPKESVNRTKPLPPPLPVKHISLDDSRSKILKNVSRNKTSYAHVLSLAIEKAKRIKNSNKQKYEPTKRGKYLTKGLVQSFREITYLKNYFQMNPDMFDDIEKHFPILYPNMELLLDQDSNNLLTVLEFEECVQQKDLSGIKQEGIKHFFEVNKNSNIKGSGHNSEIRDIVKNLIYAYENSTYLTEQEEKAFFNTYNSN